MKNVFLDTNIVLDFLIREECSKGVRNLIAMPASYNFYISYLTVANVA